MQMIKKTTKKKNSRFQIARKFCCDFFRYFFQYIQCYNDFI